MPDALRVLAGLVLSALCLTLAQRLAIRLSLFIRPIHATACKGSRPGDLVAAFTGAFLFLLFFLLTARPLSALLLVIALGALLVCLNRVKETVLHEPLILVDIYLLPQVFRYPALYFPFLPVKLLAGALCITGLCLAALLYFESSIAWMRSPEVIFAGLIILLASIALTLRMNKGHLPRLNDALLSSCPVSHDAVEDACTNGPLAAALMHPLKAGQLRRSGMDFLSHPQLRPQASHWPLSFDEALFFEKPGNASLAPHIVILQAESFFDIRPSLSAAERSRLNNFLPNWDALIAERKALPPPQNAFGAYTMRTEFAMLTGLDANALGPWSFNPYILAASRPMWSLARHFRQQDYESLCIHPYHHHFFMRHKVMPNLGFETFLSLENLEHLPCFGSYTSDIALGDEISRRLSASSQPIFCFAITMEAHGPWLPGRLNPAQIEETIGDIDYTYFEPALQLYLCHLRRMDRLIGMLRSWKDTGDNKRECIFLVYSDHAPALGIQICIENT